MLGGQACSRRLAVWPDVDDRTKADLESKRQRLARHRLELAPLTSGTGSRAALLNHEGQWRKSRRALTRALRECK
jgi:hypothetical protein